MAYCAMCATLEQQVADLTRALDETQQQYAGSVILYDRLKAEAAERIRAAEGTRDRLRSEIAALEVEFLAQTNGDPDDPLYTAAEKLHHALASDATPEAP